MALDNHLYSLGGLRQGRLYRQPKFLRTMDVFDMEQGELPIGNLPFPSSPSQSSYPAGEPSRSEKRSSSFKVIFGIN